MAQLDKLIIDDYLRLRKDYEELKAKNNELEEKIKTLTNHTSQKKYYENNSDKVKEKAKEYMKKVKEENPEKLKEWRRNAYLKRKEKLKTDKKEN
jgi:hypothetical protein